jgi:protein-tyrosine phosphatase
VFRRGVDFAKAALEEPEAKIFIHCAAGVHRAPMMALAVLRAEGWSLDDASELITARRPVADLADVYVKSVEYYMAMPPGAQTEALKRKGKNSA